MADVFLYNGELKRGSDLQFIELVYKNKKSKECVLVLVTPGGNPDAAFKISRYIQRHYDSFRIIVSGFCKSAGTLLAVGAAELVFFPYGELGPLDVQMAKTDSLINLESGLNISEALMSLEQRAIETFSSIVFQLTAASGGVVSFQTAANAANQIVSSLYSPIFGKIDPEEVGSRSRAMRIGEDYAKRLNSKFNNLKSEAIEALSRSYSSHGFVIDEKEAASLFKNVRGPTSLERQIISELGTLARHPNQALTIRYLDDIDFSEAGGDHANDDAKADTGPIAPRDGIDGNGGDPAHASSAESAQAEYAQQTVA